MFCILGIRKQKAVIVWCKLQTTKPSQQVPISKVIVHLYPNLMPQLKWAYGEVPINVRLVATKHFKFVFLIADST